MSTPLTLEEALQAESACIALFGHEYWQVISDEKLEKLKAFIRGNTNPEEVM